MSSAEPQPPTEAAQPSGSDGVQQHQIGNGDQSNQSTQGNDDQEENVQDHYPLKQAFSECMGSFVFVLLGLSSELAFQSSTVAGGRKTLSNYMVAVTWGLAQTMGLFISGTFLGGHINGSITLGLLAARRLPVKYFLIYMLAQIVGAFVAGGLAYILYAGHVDASFGGLNDDDNVPSFFAPFPDHDQSALWWLDILPPLIGTGIFALTVAAICDRRNMGITSSLAPLYIGLALTTVILALGDNPRKWLILNPTTDLGQRIMSSLFAPHIGNWGPAILAWLSSLAGGVIGAVVYFDVLENGLPYEHPSPPVGIPEYDEQDKYRHWFRPTGDAMTFPENELGDHIEPED
ncbi:Aquaporin-10 [Halotydeus destructor]|nr:Aquaporin-10 [Halotydeus destructor]